MRDRWQKIKKLTQSESTMKTPSSTTKRSHLNSLFNQVLKIFESSRNHQQEDPPTPQNFFTLPSISVTSPEGQTTVVE